MRWKFKKSLAINFWASCCWRLLAWRSGAGLPTTLFTSIFSMMLLNLPIETCYPERQHLIKCIMVRSSLRFLFCLCLFYFLWILSKTANIVMYVFQVITSHTSPVIKGSVIYQEKNSPCMQLDWRTAIFKYYWNPQRSQNTKDYTLTGLNLLSLSTISSKG